MSAPDAATRLTPLRRDLVEVVARRGRATETVAALAGHEAHEVAPGRWLVCLADGAARDFMAACTAPASVIDLSSAFVCLRLAGPEARDILARGCRLDLHPDVFRQGQAARSLHGQVPMTIIRPAADAFELHFPASLAASALHALTDVAGRFSAHIDPEIERLIHED